MVIRDTNLETSLSWGGVGKKPKKSVKSCPHIDNQLTSAFFVFVLSVLDNVTVLSLCTTALFFFQTLHKQAWIEKKKCSVLCLKATGQGGVCSSRGYWPFQGWMSLCVCAPVIIPARLQQLNSHRSSRQSVSAVAMTWVLLPSKETLCLSVFAVVFVCEEIQCPQMWRDRGREGKVGMGGVLGVRLSVLGGQGWPVNPRVVKGAVVLVSTVALHHEMSTHRSLWHVCEEKQKRGI